MRRGGLRFVVARQHRPGSLSGPEGGAEMGVVLGVDRAAARCVRAGTLLLALYCGALAARDIGSDARELTVARLQAELATHRTRVRSIEGHYAARIAALDAHGPSLHSVLEINPDAAAIAAQLDSAGGPRGPLYGVPVLLDEGIARRLRAAGALILGKTNLSEWANYRSK